MKEFWNTRYQEPQFAYGTRPNEFFQETIDKLPAGKILLPAEGEGRNAVYAARKGWEVTAFDYSIQAMLKTFQLAERHGVTLQYSVKDVQNFEPETAIYDAIGLFYTHFPIQIRPEFHQKLVQALKPDGYVILEGFHKNQQYYTSGGPKDEALLFSLEELEAEFKDLRILSLEDKVIELDEGLYHQGKAHVVRMIAIKS
ncbi:class I SAM-dependent methyltransferase [Runella aurantiaca]|uniref:Class I SAM-dependent methyltransferase n=1 Tax=Runella aurantiaca TaxID=2282308 RepID=A0A369HYB8_9BACT|nr:class I SAM-dependent methyltransferase [Runella aurantiaca]RDB02531.1 class I SAM-dependent methyltransferase [Runella aurantiaca]